MLSGGSRSCSLASFGVDTWRAIFDAFTVDVGTTLPEIDRPFEPNGTGGFRMPMKKWIHNLNQ